MPSFIWGIMCLFIVLLVSLHSWLFNSWQGIYTHTSRLDLKNEPSQTEIQPQPSIYPQQQSADPSHTQSPQPYINPSPSQPLQHSQSHAGSVDSNNHISIAAQEYEELLATLADWESVANALATQVSELRAQQQQDQQIRLDQEELTAHLQNQLDIERAQRDYVQHIRCTAEEREQLLAQLTTQVNELEMECAHLRLIVAERERHIRRLEAI